MWDSILFNQEVFIACARTSFFPSRFCKLLSHIQLSSVYLFPFNETLFIYLSIYLFTIQVLNLNIPLLWQEVTSLPLILYTGFYSRLGQFPGWRFFHCFLLKCMIYVRKFRVHCNWVYNYGQQKSVTLEVVFVIVKYVVHPQSRFPWCRLQKQNPI